MRTKKEVTKGYIEKLNDLLIPEGFSKKSIVLIANTLFELFNELTPIDLTQNKRELKTKIDKPTLKQVKDFEQVVYEISIDTNIDQLKITIGAIPYTFTDKSILDLIRQSLKSVSKHPEFHSKVFDTYLNRVWKSLAIKQFIEVVKLTKPDKSNYSISVLTYDLLKHFGFIIDDGAKSNSDKSSFISKHIKR